MRNRVMSGLKSVLVAAVVAGAMVISAPTAQAQGPDWGQMYDPPVNSREVEQMVSALKLDTAQKELVDDLQSAMSAEFERLSQIVRDMMEQVQEEARTSGRADVWADVGKKIEKFEEKKKSMQEQLFADVKLILSDEQMERWPSFERRWYRGRQMGNRQLGMISAMRADVVLLVEELKLNEEQMALVAPVLDQYEREVDRELHAFEDLTKEQQEEWNKIRDDGNWLANMDKMNELFSDLRDKLIVVRNLNGKYRDQVAMRLEGEAKDKFAAAYEKAAFPTVYKDSYVDSGIRTVLEMPSLTGEQQSEVVALQERYEAEMMAINKRLEKAMLEADTKVKLQDLWGSGSAGAEKAEIEAEKKKLMSDRFAQLRALLTEEQAKKLPSPEGEDWRNTDFDF